MNDDIAVKMVQQGDEMILRLLSTIFHRVQMRSKTSQEWKDAILIYLYKKGSKDICDNYYGISLLLVVGKIFTRILLKQILDHIAPNILPD